MEAISDKHLDTAYSIGRKLCREAIWLDEQCTWQGADVWQRNGHWQLVNRTFGPDLYDGVAGIALFLAELSVRVDDAIVDATLEGAMRNLMRQSDELKTKLQIGFYRGIYGVGYALWRIGRLKSNRTWLEAGLSCFERLKKVGTADPDQISGVAGSIPVLLKLHQEQAFDDGLALAISYGQRLIDMAEKKEEFWTWQTQQGELPLTGYAQGAAGIALALLELSHASGIDDFKEAAWYGFAYENAHFDARQNNWLDLRYYVRNRQTADDQPGCSDGWDHGAPGIGLSRLRAYELTGNVDFLQEARLALDTTCELVSAHLKNPAGTNYSLSRGLAGNADILMEGSVQLNEPVYAQVAQQVAKLGRMLYDHTDSDWPSGVEPPLGAPSGKYPSPGLLTGLAGTGFFYLRLTAQKPESILMIT